MLNPRTDTSIFTWMGATLYTVKLLSLTAKGSDSDQSVWRNRFSIWPVNLHVSNIFFCGGHNEQPLSKQIQRALNIAREACMQSIQNREKPTRIPLVVTYHPIFSSFHMTTMNHLPFLHVSEWLWKAFWYPPLISVCRPKNLKDFLVWTTLTSTPSEPSDNYQCGVFTCRCKSCPILRVTNEFSSYTTGQDYKVKFCASCKSSNIVYLIRCRRYGLQ